MNSFSFLFVGTLAASMLVACHSHDHGHDHGHSHDHGHGHSGHGADSHDEHSEARAQLWAWTPDLEMFVDLEAPTEGEPCVWAIHATNLRTGNAVDTCEWTFVVQPPSGREEALTSPLEKPGYAEVTWTPSQAGPWNVLARWASPKASGQLDLGELVVAKPGEMPQEEPAHAGDVSVTKEQVWAIPFGVEMAQTGPVQHVIRGAGKWVSAPGEAAVLHAPGKGEVRHAMKALVPGMTVAAGDVLFELVSGNMGAPGFEAQRTEAEAEFAAAESAFLRLTALHEAGAASRKELDEAEKRWKLAREAQTRANALGSGGALEVRAPRAGVVRDVRVAQGEYVSEGQPLVTLAASETSLLELNLSAQKASQLSGWSNISIEVGGEWLEGDVVSVGRAISAQTGLVSVFVSCPAAGKGVFPGGFAEVSLRHGTGRNGLLIPSSAVMERYGLHEVAVQTGGESYDLRQVRLGANMGERVEVVEGLSAGELVVVEGEYAVRMASMKGSTPAHGHTH